METINHYVNEGSNVYSCLLDASKAFDRVHWGRLFKILIERKVSFILFIRLPLDSYLSLFLMLHGDVLSLVTFFE